MSLSDMNIGDIAIIKELNANELIKRRLLDIGLINGTKVECMMKSPLGNPIAYLIRGAVIAIRNEDSSKIVVDKL
ncbi:MAG: FeoA family protein [Bacilli bacterium]